MTPNEEKITRLVSELACSINENLGRSVKVQKILKEIEQDGYHIEVIMSAAIGSSRERLSPYLIKKILSGRHLKKTQKDEETKSEFTEDDVNFLKSLGIKITKPDYS